MIPAGVQIFVSLEPVDMRYGFERLAGLVRERVGYDARSGALYVFVGKRGSTAKVLSFDGTGMCLLHKRLDRRTFSLPASPAPDLTQLEIDDATPTPAAPAEPTTPSASATPTDIDALSVTELEDRATQVMGHIEAIKALFPGLLWLEKGQRKEHGGAQCACSGPDGGSH